MRLWLCFVPLLLTPLTFGKDKAQQAGELIGHAKKLSDIRAGGSPPFILKAQFKILSDPAHPTLGTYTEIWASPSLWRKEISAEEFSTTEVVNGKKRWQRTSAKEIPADISEALIQIAYNTWGLDSREPAAITDRQSGSWSVRCIVGQDDGLGGRGEECFDVGTGLLVAEAEPVLVPGGEAANRCVFTEFQKFGEKLFPRSLQCFKNDRRILQVDAVQLKSEKPDDSVFAEPSDAKEFPNCPAGGKPPEAIVSKDPEIRATGAVVVSIAVGTDGKPHDATVIASSDPKLERPVLDALRQWRFKAGSCQGQPMEMNVKVDFKMRADFTMRAD